MCVGVGGGRWGAVLCLQEPQQQRSLGDKCASGTREGVGTDLAPENGPVHTTWSFQPHRAPLPLLRPLGPLPPSAPWGSRPACAWCWCPWCVDGLWGESRSVVLYHLKGQEFEKPCSPCNPSLVPTARCGSLPPRRESWARAASTPAGSPDHPQPWAQHSLELWIPTPRSLWVGWGCSLQGGLGTGWGPGVLAA